MWFVAAASDGYDYNDVRTTDDNMTSMQKKKKYFDKVVTASFECQKLVHIIF